jgi:protein phosphatase
VTLAVRYTARSNVGRVREGNEDSAYAGPHLLMVADGMGGHAAGEVASAAAVDTIRRLDHAPRVIEGEPADGPQGPAATARYLLRDAIVRANDQLRLLSERDVTRRGMGTTVTAMLWDGERFAVAHVGDSRAYLLRDGSLRQITRDHTFVQTLIDEGRLSPEEANLHPQRSVILRALDGRETVELDLFDLVVQPGDRVLVCSDGLSGVVSPEEIENTLGQGDLDQAADALVQRALDAGAPDNVTCIVAEVLDLESALDGGPELVVGAAADVDLSEPDSSTGALPLPVGADDDGDDSADDARRTPDEEELRYAPLQPARFRWARRIGIAIVALAVLGGLGYAFLSWTKTQYYVGVEDNRIAIFRGLDQRIVGQPLSDVYEISDVEVDDLPIFDRQQIEASISAASLDDARTIAARLATRAAACERLRAQAASEEPAGPAGPTASPGATMTPPDATADPTASGGVVVPPPTGAPTTAQPTTALPTQSSPGETTPHTPSASATPRSTPGQGVVTRAECGIDR